jgi:hypothetical protein
VTLFDSRRSDTRKHASKALKELARELLGADPDDVVMVNELACSEPGCPPLETVVALLRTGEPPQQLKIHKPVVEVTRADVEAALAGHHHDAK